MAMQSSPVSKSQSSISTFSHDSGSHPSLFGPWLCIFTPFMVTFSDSSGWISQNGERLMVNPSSRMFLHLYKLMNCGRMPFAFSKTRSFTGIESAFIWYSRVFSLTVSPFSALMPRMRCSANQLSVLACPSSFPFPVMAILFSPYA